MSPRMMAASDCNSTATIIAMDDSQASTPRAEYDPMRVRTPDQLEVLNLLVHPVWIFDGVEKRMRWANTVALEMWNAETLEELLARDYSDISEASAKRLDEFLEKTLMGLNFSEQWTLYPKGQAKTVHMNVSGIRLSEEEDHPSFFFEGIPIVKEELVNENLRGVEMLRHLPMAVCQFDMNGQVMFQNPEATLGNLSPEEEHKEPEDKINKIDNNPQKTQCEEKKRRSITSAGTATTTSSCKPKTRSGALQHRFVDPAVGKELLETMQRADKCDIEAMLHTSTGPKWSAIQARRSKDPVTGESVILYSARDKSDAIRAKEEREAKERKSIFIAIMAHEIRTPLHQVTGFIDLLDQTPLNAEQKSFVKLLKSSAKGLMTVISDVLDFSKLEAGKMKLECLPYEPLSVVEGSMAAVRASCEERGISLTLEWAKDIPFRLLGDPNRLRQILLNLLSNAVKFVAKDHGKIHVEAVRVEGPSSKKKGENRPMVKFVVKDNGIGISKDHQKIIFRKYQQADVSIARNFGGTGLGLSICKLLTENMGGTIGVESEVGKGASFWFCLPAELAAEKKIPETNESDETKFMGSLHVLIVEDNKVNQKLMANMLRRMGHKSELAENGEEAIERIQKENFDLVLMDIQMPVMDGLEATRRLRTMGYKDLPIYGLTASVARSDFADLGFNDWLPKPIPMKDLKAKLNRVKHPQLPVEQRQ